MSHPNILDFKKIEVVPGKTISVAELSQNIPFAIRRVYWVNNISDSDISEHAHKSLHQVVVPLKGVVTVELEDKQGKVSKFVLASNSTGLHIPPLHWKRIHYQPDIILLCFASESYDEKDYIRDYSAFKNL